MAGPVGDDSCRNPAPHGCSVTSAGQLTRLSDLAQGLQWALNTVGPLVVDVATELGRAVGYLTGAGVIAPLDPPLLDADALAG